MYYIVSWIPQYICDAMATFILCEKSLIISKFLESLWWFEASKMFTGYWNKDTIYSSNNNRINNYDFFCRAWEKNNYDFKILYIYI